MTCYCTAPCSNDCPHWYKPWPIIYFPTPYAGGDDFAAIERRILISVEQDFATFKDRWYQVYGGGRQKGKTWAELQKRISQTEAEIAPPEFPPSNRRERRAAAAQQRRRR